MSTTIAVTRNLPGRFNGFLTSCMLEVAPGVYVAPRMKKSVRERVWKVMMEWAELIPSDGGMLLAWRDQNAPSGLSIRTLGWPKKELLEHEGTWLAVGNLRDIHDPEELERLAAKVEDV